MPKSQPFEPPPPLNPPFENLCYSAGEEGKGSMIVFTHRPYLYEQENYTYTLTAYIYNCPLNAHSNIFRSLRNFWVIKINREGLSLIKGFQEEFYK